MVSASELLVTKIARAILLAKHWGRWRLLHYLDEREWLEPFIDEQLVQGYVNVVDSIFQSGLDFIKILFKDFHHCGI